MPGIYSANAAIHAERDLISTLKNSAPAALFVYLGTEKLYALRKLADIFQGKITEKTNLRQLKHIPK